MVHGGAGNSKDNEDGCVAAARQGMRGLRAGGDALSAVVQSVVYLEDDERFNAGAGSVVRIDGETVETDASVMDSQGRLGAVCCVRAVKNPVLLAERVTVTPHWMLAGAGAEAFARAQGLAAYRPAKAAAGMTARGGDTVGAVALDVHGTFAVACSTGGTDGAMLGRVGDTPIPGSGFWAGPHGAVAATGTGEAIVPRMLARAVYEWIAQGMALRHALAAGIALLPESTEVGLIGVTPTEAAAAGNRCMPAHVIEHGHED